MGGGRRKYSRRANNRYRRKTNVGVIKSDPLNHALRLGPFKLTPFATRSGKIKSRNFK
jgi:hypothetical protein